jgi:hypothetical protein
MFKLSLWPVMREYLKYTLLAIALSIAAKFAIYAVDPLHEGVGKYFILIAPSFTVAMLYPGMILTRNIEFGGFLSGRLLSAAGVRIAVISAGINGFFDYLYFTAINKALLPNYLVKEIARINADTTMEPLLKENALKGAANFFTPFMQVTFPMFITVCSGIAFTLILAYFLRKYPEGTPKKPFFSLPEQPE